MTWRDKPGERRRFENKEQRFKGQEKGKNILHGAPQEKGKKEKKELCADYFEFPSNRNFYSSLVKAIIDCFEDYSKHTEEKSAFNFNIVSGQAVKNIAKHTKEEYWKNLMNSTKNKVEEIQEALMEQKCKVFSLEIKTKSRMLVSAKSPYIPLEIGLSWDPYMNVPYIPATSIKGFLRAQLSDKFSEKELDKLFGSQESEGLLMIFDAYPIKFENALIEPEVIAPHYKENEEKIEELSSTPIPLLFITVAKGVTLKSPVAVCGNIREEEWKLVEDFIEKINNSDIFVGIGAKTAVGFGDVELKVIEKKSK